MMRDEDIGRVLDEWFVEGPTQMPGRFFTATCDRIDRVPDRRFAPGLPRLSPASRKRGLAAAAAVLVVTVGVAGAFVTQNAGIGLAPSRTPAGSVAPFASSEPSARSLQGAWVPSGVRPPGTNAPYGIAIGPSNIELHEVEGRFLSSWSIVPPNRLELVLQSTTPGMDCPPGDHASYAFRVAADGVLTLDPLGDTCLLRTANLTGDWVRFSAPVVPLASALQSSWTSDVLRPVPGGCCPARYDIVIGPSTIRIPGSKADLLSSASAADPDVIDLKVAPSEGAAIPEAQRSPTDWQCPVGSAGTYAFALSQDGSTLELTPTSDACAPRAAVLAGGWIRTDMGALAPGRHDSTLFTPYVGSGGHFSYAVPAGWSDVYECAKCLSLTAPDALSSIDVAARVVPSTLELGPGCADVAGRRSPGAIAEWLASLPSLAVGTPQPVTIGGLSGVFVDVALARGWETATCPFFHSGGGSVTLADPGSSDRTVTVPDDGRSRFILLDRGDDGTLLIDLAAAGTTQWDRVVAEAMPIIGSFEFGR